MSDQLLIFISACLVNNLVLHHLIGVGTGVALTRKIDVAAGMSVVTAAVIVVTTPVSYAVAHGLLNPYGLQHFQLLAFVMLNVLLVLAGSAGLARLRPDWHARFRDFVPLVLANTSVLGVALLNAGQNHGIAGSLFYGLGAAAGFALVLIVVAAMHERLLAAELPRPFKGTAALLMALGILSMAFMGFTGLAKL